MDYEKYHSHGLQYKNDANKIQASFNILDRKKDGFLVQITLRQRTITDLEMIPSIQEKQLTLILKKYGNI